MSEWSLYGTDRRDVFEKSYLDPEMMLMDLKRYQIVFGKEFGLQELLIIKDLQAKAMIAEAVNDAPEFLVAQLMKNKDDIGFYDIACSIGEISEEMERARLNRPE